MCWYSTSASSVSPSWTGSRDLAADRRVVAFSADITDDTIRAVFDAGASAYLSKHEGSEHFIAAVVAAATDRPYVTPSVAKAMLGDASPSRPRLSAQEQRALRLWFQLPKKHNVARDMGISVETVDQYISRARIKYAAVGPTGAEQGGHGGSGHRGRARPPGGRALRTAWYER